MIFWNKKKHHVKGAAWQKLSNRAAKGQECTIIPSVSQSVNRSVSDMTDQLLLSVLVFMDNEGNATSNFGISAYSASDHLRDTLKVSDNERE